LSILRVGHNTSMSIFNYNKKKQRKAKGAALIAGTLFGAALAGVITVFTTPVTGKQARQAARTKADEISSSLKKSGQEIVDKARKQHNKRTPKDSKTQTLPSEE